VTAISQEPLTRAPERRRWTAVLGITQMWAGVSIVAIWLAVLFTAVYGPDIVDRSGVASVGNSTTVPSVIAVALFAFLATWVVAKHGFGRRETRD
jgi:hypothetical protein